MLRYLIATLVVTAVVATTVFASIYTFGSDRVVYSKDEEKQGLAVADQPSQAAQSAQNTNETRQAAAQQRTSTGNAGPYTDSSATANTENATAARTDTEENIPRSDERDSTMTASLRSYVSTLAEKVQTEDMAFTDTTHEAAAQSFLEDQNVKQMVSSYKHYTTNDLTLVKDPDQAFLQQYADHIASALSPRGQREKVSAYPLYLNAKKAPSDSKRQQYVQKLKKAHDHYTAIRTKLLTMDVPAEAAEHHIDLVNSISVLAARIKGMEKIATDPIRAIIHGTAYKTQAQAFVVSYRRLQRYLAEHNIALEAV